MLTKKRVISIDVSIGRYQDFLDEIVALSLRKESAYICVANVHMVIEAYDDKEFQQIVNKAAIVTPDGMPLVKVLKAFYGIQQDRVAGMDIFPDLLRRAAENGLRVYLYGSTDQVLNEIKKRAKHLYPDLQIVGMYSPPFRELTSEEQEMIVEKINSVSPHLVFVSLGCPKQEKWMAKMQGKVHATMIGVGAAFLTFIGELKRAPKWMQDLSMEWLFRLVQEPQRLFKRYAYTSPKFVYLFFKHRKLMKRKR